MSNIRRRRTPARRAGRTAAALVLSTALGACALSANGPGEVEEPGEDLRVVRYAVEPGDRLSIITRDFTGDIALWPTIADLNGIADPRRLAVGQVIEIPVALIPEDRREARLAASLPVEGDDGAARADNAATRLAALRERASRDEARAGAASPPPAPETGPESLRETAEPVVVSAVRSPGEFEMSPIDGSAGTPAAGGRAVQVIGSYTPKGVYVEPAGRSRVLTRITPGTVLALEGEVDGWFRVRTSAGPGYLRAEDARVVGPDGAIGQ